jgi:D-amino peptidase
MSDLNAAIEGTLEGGATEIVVYDMHYYGLNVILNELHPRAKIIMGNPHVVPSELGLNATYKGMIMVGYHAMAKTGGALLPHTYALDMKSLYLNGVLMGEIGLEAAIAGTFGVPLIMISGDSKGIEEAEKLLKRVEKAVVKYAISKEGAVCLPPSTTRETIKKRAKIAVKRIDRFTPYKVPSPYEIRLEFYETSSAEKASKITGVNRLDDRTIQLKGNDLSLMWKTFISKYQ